MELSPSALSKLNESHGLKESLQRAKENDIVEKVLLKFAQPTDTWTPINRRDVGASSTTSLDTKEKCNIESRQSAFVRNTYRELEIPVPEEEYLLHIPAVVISGPASSIIKAIEHRSIKSAHSVDGVKKVYAVAKAAGKGKGEFDAPVSEHVLNALFDASASRSV